MLSATVLLLVLLNLGMSVALVRQDRAALAQERERVNELLLLLEAKAAPAEVAAFLQPFPEPPAENFLVSDDGLIVVSLEGEG